MSTTLTTPIRESQINDVFYVTLGGFSTIQAAVDYARTKNSGVGQIIVCHGHDYSEDIRLLTGGNASIYITDLRDGRYQNWTWTGSSFAPFSFNQTAGFIAQGIATPPTASTGVWYDPAGTGGAGTGRIRIIGNPGQTIRPSLNIEIQQAGNPNFNDVFMRLEAGPDGRQTTLVNSELHALSQPEFLNVWVGQPIYAGGTAKGMYIWEKPEEDAIDFQGQTVIFPAAENDQTIRLNQLGGDVIIAPEGTTSMGSVTADTIEANDTSFETCLVANSPVRTFANSGDVEGMQWPPAGIGVSTGTSWEEESIDPATLATVTELGNYLPLAGGTLSGALAAGGNITVNGFSGFPPISRATSQTILTGNALGMQLVNASGATDQKVSFIQVAQGAANTIHFGFQNDAGTSNHDYFTILPNGNQASQIVINSPRTTIGLNAPLTLFDRTNVDTSLYPTTPNINCDATNLFINPAGGIGAGIFLNWDQGTVVNFGSGVPNAPQITTQIDRAGNVMCGNAVFAGEINTIVPNARYVQLSCDVNGNSGNGVGILQSVHNNVGWSDINICPNGGNIYAGTTAGGGVSGTLIAGNMQVRGEALILSESLSVHNGDLVIASHTGGLPGSQATIWYDPTGPNLQINSPGQMYLNWNSNQVVNIGTGGFNTSGPKNFRISHPHAPESKWLFHSTVEGPEHAVFYRGESETVDGYVVITLPEYFEDLTRPEDRTVQLTMIADEEPPMFAQLAAGRVKDGKCKVYSSKPTVKFFWEIKAVRADLDPLEVVTEKTEHDLNMEKQRKVGFVPPESEDVTPLPGIKQD